MLGYTNISKSLGCFDLTCRRQLRGSLRDKHKRSLSNFALACSSFLYTCPRCHRGLALVYLLCHKVYIMFQRFESLSYEYKLEGNSRLLINIQKRQSQFSKKIYWSLFTCNSNIFDLCSGSAKKLVK